MGYSLSESRIIAIPFQFRDELLGIEGLSRYWVFARPSYQPSVWMALKREGFSGDWIFTSQELDLFKSEVGLAGITAVLSFLYQRPIETKNPFKLWSLFEDTVLTQSIQVYQFQRSDHYRLCDPEDRYFSSIGADQYIGNSPRSALRYKLTDILGNEILARWRSKSTADQSHFALPWYKRELIELADMGNAVVNPAWEAIIDLKDALVFVCEFVYHTALDVAVSAKVSMKKAAQFYKSLTESIIKGLEGDPSGLQQRLAEIGIPLYTFGQFQLKTAQELKRLAGRISDTIMQHLKEGMRLLNLILSDPRTRDTLVDYIRSLFESANYRDSRVAGIHAVSTTIFEFGPDIAIGLATGGAGALAIRAAKTASRINKASKIRHGPFSPQAMDAMADLAKVIDGEQSIGKALTPPKGVDVPDYAATKAKPKEKAAPTPKVIPIMKRHDVPCFKAGSKIPSSKYPEYDRQLAAQQNGLNDMTVQEYLDGRKSYQAMGRGNGRAQKQARLDYKKRRFKEIKKELQTKGIVGEKAVGIIERDLKSEMDTLDALHNPDMIAGGKDIVSELGDRAVNRSIGTQWLKPKGTSRVEDIDVAANQALKSEGPEAKMNVNMHRCK